MSIDDRDAELIAQMAKNKLAMEKIERKFFVSGILCIVVNIYGTVIGFLLIPAMLGWDKRFFILDTVAAVTSVVCSILSSCKHKNWTVWALALFLLRTLISTVCYHLMAGLPILLCGAIPQFICMKQYKKLDFLKTQFGYPGFNADIYMHRARRMMSDEEVRERMKRQTETVDSRNFGGVIPPDTGEEYEDPVSYRIKPPLD